MRLERFVDDLSVTHGLALRDAVEDFSSIPWRLSLGVREADVEEVIRGGSGGNDHESGVDMAGQERGVLISVSRFITAKHLHSLQG